jgi:sarcosine oxidase subunit beta
MARIVIAGAGAIGASIAYHLSLAEGDHKVTLCDKNDVASGATGKAMGGVRQQFTTAPEVRLAQASARFFAELGPPLFEQVGYLFLATSPQGVAELEERVGLQRDLGVPVEDADPAGVTRHLVRDARSRGVELREYMDARELDADVLVIACGAGSPALASRHEVELPIRPLVRQLVDTRAVEGLPDDLPMTVEAETGFHFRRVDRGLRLAMGEPAPRWGEKAEVDQTLVTDWLERLAHRYPPAAGVAVSRSWAGLYDMTPDAHPIIGWVAEGVYAACGFSGHGFMQAPAVGDAVAQELLDREPAFDLSPYRLDRFEAGAVFPERLVL